MSRWTLIGLVAAAGTAGTLARWGLATVANRWWASSWGSPASAGAAASVPTPGWGWPGTLAVNLLGCFAFGIVWGLSEKHGAISHAARVAILTGFMGAFTTFSSLAFDTGALMRAGRMWAAAANLAANNVLGLGLFFAGMALVGGLASKA